MNKQKIALLVDSGSDVPKDLIDQYNMYVAPLTIIYSDGEYVDGVEITTKEVYDRLEEEIPTTSLPTGEAIQSIYDQIKKDGYEKVLAITISSGLSGTYNMIKMVGDNQEGLEVFVIDSKNISIASGFNAIQAAEYIKEGMTWETLKETVSKNILNSKVYFYVSTLKYLQKGGRIGLVASILGSGINLKPLISCNDDGIYYTRSKAIGEARALNRLIALAVEHIGDSKDYNIGVVHAAAPEKASRISDRLLKRLSNPKLSISGEISAALGVHTGPDSIGIVVQKL